MTLPTQHTVTVGDANVRSVHFSNTSPLTIIAGPCVIESRQHALDTAMALREIAEQLNIGLIYKSSFDKANRTSGSAYRGVDMTEGLDILSEVREKSGLPVITDVHSAHQCADVANVVDILQIPAFLCRQTDLLMAAAQTGKPVNVKKGQFLAPWDMKNVLAKFISEGHHQVMLCERGASFGYNTLVSDMRALPIMKQTGQPVIFDATHSVQQPGGQGASSGGQREFVTTLAKAAVAIGVAGIFFETHENPDKALSDGPNMLFLKDFPNILKVLMRYDELAKSEMSQAI